MKSTITEHTSGSITFVVDENLPKPSSHVEDCLSVMDIAESRLSEYDLAEGRYKSPEIVAASGDENLYSIGEDVFFQTLLKSYAEHRPVVISPDMIWTLICQGFSHHINMDPEKYRHMLVSHEGKKELEVLRDSMNAFTKDDWAEIITEFAQKVEESTKGTVAASLITDFSTTTSTEAIASRITLLSTVKSYFEFIVVQFICGIPYITLKGTPDDWRTLLEKSKELAQFDLEWWISELTSILEEFVKASEGHPSPVFWKSIVMTWRPGQMGRGGGCVPNPEGPTKVDGWFLKFFPYCKNGRTPDSIAADESMLPETVAVPFIYRVVDGTGNIVKETRMSMMAGLIGVSEDKETFALTPKFGWYINVEETEEELFRKLQEQDDSTGIQLRIGSVPEVLKRFSHIKCLELNFIDKVSLPEWMDKIIIDCLIIEGEMTRKKKTEIKKRFPNCHLR